MAKKETEFELLSKKDLDKETQRKITDLYVFNVLHPEAEDIPYMYEATENHLKSLDTKISIIKKGKEISGFIIVSPRTKFFGENNGLVINGIYVNPEHKQEFKEKFNWPMFAFLNGVAGEYAEKKKMKLHLTKQTKEGKRAYDKARERGGFDKNPYLKIIKKIKRPK